MANFDFNFDVKLQVTKNYSTEKMFLSKKNSFDTKRNKKFWLHFFISESSSEKFLRTPPRKIFAEKKLIDWPVGKIFVDGTPTFASVRRRVGSASRRWLISIRKIKHLPAPKTFFYFAESRSWVRFLEMTNMIIIDICSITKNVLLSMTLELQTIKFM